MHLIMHVEKLCGIMGTILLTNDYGGDSVEDARSIAQTITNIKEVCVLLEEISKEKKMELVENVLNK